MRPTVSFLLVGHDGYRSKYCPIFSEHLGGGLSKESRSTVLLHAYISLCNIFTCVSTSAWQGVHVWWRRFVLVLPRGTCILSFSRHSERCPYRWLVRIWVKLAWFVWANVAGLFCCRAKVRTNAAVPGAGGDDVICVLQLFRRSGMMPCWAVFGWKDSTVSLTYYVSDHALHYGNYQGNCAVKFQFQFSPVLFIRGVFGCQEILLQMF